MKKLMLFLLVYFAGGLSGTIGAHGFLGVAGSFYLHLAGLVSCGIVLLVILLDQRLKRPMSEEEWESYCRTKDQWERDMRDLSL